MSAGSYGVWAQKAGDFHAREFDGTPSGVSDAVAYCGSNGIVSVFPGFTGSLPAIPAGVRVILHDSGRITEYGAGGRTGAPINANDYATVQDAVDALGGNPGVVRLPARTLTPSTTPAYTGLTLPINTVLQGDGREASVLHLASGSTTADNVVIAGGCELRNLTLRGRGTGSGCGVKSTGGADNLIIDNCVIWDTGSWGISLTGSGDVINNRISNSTVFGAISGGSLLVGQSGTSATTLFCESSHFNGPGFGTYGTGAMTRGGVHLINMTSGVFHRCIFDVPDGSTALSMEAAPNNIGVRDCYFEESSSDGSKWFITTSGHGNFNVQNCWFKRNTITATGPRILKTDSNFVIRCAQITDCTISSLYNGSVGTPTDDLSLGNAADSVYLFNNRVEDANGERPLRVTGGGIPSVASGTTIDLPNRGPELCTLTGTSTVTSIRASSPGRRITIITSSTASLTDGSNLKLNGSFTGAADRTITLICDGTNWYEIARNLNA